MELLREKNNENLEVWYGEYKYKTKDLKEYITFLTLLMDEVLIAIAHVCKDTRELEGRP
jgi:hypothetical protein